MTTPPAGGGERTLAMTVKNTGFMVDRLGKDCSPLQYLRELTQNAIEAILGTPGQSGDVIWDVDWDRFDLTSIRKLCIIDNGIGMTGDEQTTYVNQLSSSIHVQSHDRNFGLGAKVAAAPKNREGLIYLSWKHNKGTMTHLWRDPETYEYGLRQLAKPDGTYNHWAYVEDTLKPPTIAENGTKVVLLGNSEDEETIEPPPNVASATKWIRRYLNTRYYQFPDGIRVRVREGWDQPRTNHDLNVLRQVSGQRAYLEDHAISQGTVPLSEATAHWWILKNDDALNGNSGQIASKGHIAALYQNELYEMMESRAGVGRLQLFGVILGYAQVVIYVEPKPNGHREVSSNTARTHLLINSEPLPWDQWATEFRTNMPPEISTLIEEVAVGGKLGDHKNSIRERLKRIRDLFRVSKYRPTPAGKDAVDADVVVRGGIPDRRDDPPKSGNGRSGTRGGRAGDVYALFLKADGLPAELVDADPTPDVKWVSVKDGTRDFGILEDRAAKYLPETNLIQINADFRVFTDMVERYSVQFTDAPGARDIIEDVVREWFEQAIVETVLGVQSLAGSKEWTFKDIGDAWSEIALTAAVLPRWHIDVAIKRSVASKLGTIREKVV